MLGRNWNTGLFRRLMMGSDIGLIEGVMGLFDGYDGRTESGSSAEMAKWLGVPVVLVVDARSMARSAAALIYGFTHFDPALQFAGVIFNRIGGKAHLEFLKEAVGTACPEVAVLGGIPREQRVSIPERHLGLVTADEMNLDSDWQKRLAALMEKHIDIDLLLAKTSFTAPSEKSGRPDGGKGDATPQTHSFKGSPRPIPESTVSEMPDGPQIAVARDPAFCFYYPDNLELLEQAGARIRFFSPISGQTFPEECSGVYLGGGYPELFAKQISDNTDFLQALRSRAALGMPIYAECGGLMTLGRFIETIEGNRYAMAAILPFGTRMLSTRKALGYTEVVLRKQCLLGVPGSVIRGHEFHYSEIIAPEEGVEIESVYDLRMRKHEASRPEGYRKGSVLASYIHLHWGSAPEAPDNFVRCCAEWEKRDKGD
jgi:cobyrinic acid a,c-diamide synthase